MSFYLPAIHNPSSVSLFHGCLSETTRAAHREDMFWDGVEHLSRFPPVHRTERSPPPTWHLQTIHTWHTVPAWGCHSLCPSMHLFGLAGSQASLDHRPPWGPSFLPSWGVTFTPAVPFVSAYWISPIVSSEVHRPPGAPLLSSPQLHCSHRALSAPPLSTCAATDVPTP